jgi:EmrB/QacA subfamily drug resistance transporter
MESSPPLDPRRWWALGALVICLLVVGFDGTILNVALPTMAAQIGASTQDGQWIVDAYIVVFASAMLPAGLLGDRFGRRRMMIVGLSLFLGGSLLGTLAGSPGPVIAARTVMGLGGSLIMPLSMSLIPVIFGDEERSKAVGIVTAASALGFPLGPIIGGWLLDHFWWGSVFLLNVPTAGLGIVACAFLLRETRDPATPRVDPLSFALTFFGLGALIYAIIDAPQDGWGDPLVVGMLAGSVLALTALVLRERQMARPMLDLDLLARPGFLWNAMAGILVTFVLMGLLFVLPQYLQSVLGYDAFGTGLRVLPMMAGLLVAARGSAPLVKRFGPRVVVPAGLLVLTVAGGLGARTSVSDGYGWTATWLSLTGLGFGFAMIPAMDAALGALPRERAGSGSGLLMTLRQTGGAIGVALLGSLLASSFATRLDVHGLPASAAGAARKSVVAAHALAAKLPDRALAASANSAFVHGMDVVLVVCAAAALAAAVLAAALLPDTRAAKAAPGPAADVAAEPVDARQ